MAIDVWPPLTHRWYSGKDADGDFNPEEFEKVYVGTTLTGVGRFILDPFSKDRSGVSGVNALDVESTKRRFSTVCSFAGRIWYSGDLGSATESSKIFYSKVITTHKDLGTLYQEADPTSEENSDLIDTDGGEITIPEAQNILAIRTFQTSVMVFATNGVWEIKGLDSVFTPAAYYVRKVSPNGILNVRTLVDVEGVPFWWGFTGIYSLSKSEVSGEASVVDISDNVIGGLWKNIPSASKLSAVGEYDITDKRIYWMYSTDGVDTRKLESILILDLRQQAYIPWRIEESPDGDYPVGLFFFKGSRFNLEEENSVIANSEEVVIGLENVTVGTSSTTPSEFIEPSLKITYLTASGRLGFAKFTGTDFYDWGETSYDSYVIGGFDFLGGGATLMKNVPYVTTYLQQTEDGFVMENPYPYTSDYYTPTNPSSCYMSVKWDLKSNFTTPRQIYKIKRNIIVDEDNLSSFDSGYDWVVTRNKLRGRGRALVFKFESEEGKDFNLMGYEMIVAINGEI